MKNINSRHGGNHGRNDRHEAEQAKAVRNTDVDSLRRGREQEKAEGHTSGHRE